VTAGELIPWIGGGGALTVLGALCRWLRTRKRLRLTLDVDEVRFDFQVTRASDP
jgi:hypothetical protein